MNTSDNEAENSLFDTAEVYGKDHRSEELLGMFRDKDARYKSLNKPLLLTKFAPSVLRIGSNRIREAANDSLNRLKQSKIDLYQLHWPPSPLLWQEEEYLQGMVELVNEGKVMNIGVSNYGPLGIRRVNSIVNNAGSRIYTNQVQMSLLAQNMLQDGIVETC